MTVGKYGKYLFTIQSYLSWSTAGTNELMFYCWNLWWQGALYDLCMQSHVEFGNASRMPSSRPVCSEEVVGIPTNSGRSAEQVEWGGGRVGHKGEGRLWHITWAKIPPVLELSLNKWWSLAEKGKYLHLPP